MTIETVGDLVYALEDLPFAENDKVYATTPHGTYLFEVAAVEESPAGHERAVTLRLREVSQ